MSDVRETRPPGFIGITNDPELWQQVANDSQGVFLDGLYQLLGGLAKAINPDLDDGDVVGVDSGPVVAGAVAAILRISMSDYTPDSVIRQRMIEQIDAIIPQIRMDLDLQKAGGSDLIGGRA